MRSPLLRKGNLTHGKFLLPFTLTHTSSNFRGKGCQTGALIPIFQWGAMSVRDTFVESFHAGVKNLAQEWWFFPDIRYPPQTLTPAWCWDLALDCCLNQNLLYFSLSLHFSIPLFLSNLLPRIFCGDPGWHISVRITVQDISKNFPPCSNPLTNIQDVILK